MKDKKQIFEACLAELNSRYAKLEEIFLSLSSAAESESKSTAGDKHETGRAMIQIEQEKIAKQMKEVRDLKVQLQTIDLNNSGKIKIGSVVVTDKGTFFIAAAIGKVGDVMTVSPVSPLARKLIGLKKHEHANINSLTYQVLDVM